ncbi:MAG: hydrogenase maturation nickel metallochaperone HypA [Desulfurivibrio sp.]|nr:hydrogenase maturation nickel metallochaperone HypA [Desulfurivibrio sp.]
MSIAISIVELACQQAGTAGAGRITRVEVEVGALAGVLADSLRFCYEAASRDTMAADSELVIIELPGDGECASCHGRRDMTEALALCPDCGGIMRPRGGRELRLRAIEVDD